tara:strand:- start:29148 stop:29840 length:693 start_codon:yes stop_codon:yes gene_type:complete
MQKAYDSHPRGVFLEVTKMSRQDPSDKSEMRLTGLILTQSALVGVAIGIYDAGLWLPGGTGASQYVNGMTYAMGALAIQILAYYLFKMFFEEQMQERVRMSEMQRQRDYRFREQQFSYDQRRADMELRMQEMQLEKELIWMQQNPGKMPPSMMSNSQSSVSGLGVDLHNTSRPPQHTANITSPQSFGLDSLADDIMRDVTTAPRDISSESPRLKKDGTPDLRYKKGSGGV